MTDIFEGPTAVHAAASHLYLGLIFLSIRSQHTADDQGLCIKEKS